MKEIWKDIKGYEGYYQVSNFGKIKSLQFNNRTTHFLKREKILKMSSNKAGYQQVALYKNKTKKIVLVHRLVMEAFMQNPNNLEMVNHKDENPKNNIVTNLEWCSRKYNSLYGNATKKMSEKHKKSIIQLTKEGKFVKKWNSAIDVYKELNISNSLISLCLTGKIKTAGGFKWIYA